MTLRYDRDGGIAHVRLDRPDRLNTLTTGLVRELVAAFDTAHADPEVRAVVLSGAGDRAFCAGRDLDEAGVLGDAEPVPMRGTDRNVFETILECGKPTVAALHGHVLGGGAELALACDVRIAADDLSIGFPEVRVGFGANFASVLLPRTVPRGVAYDMLYTGRRMTAGEAAACHLVNRVVPAGRAAGAALEYARGLLQGAPLTQQRYKAMIVKGEALPVAAALRLDAAPNPYRSTDRHEGVAAWRERRAPRWEGR
ncbi:enoyl-CoA hydratase-related protein [Actinomadura viridis]|uniref:Enoyl-CoA hydratase/carnithine racemase n=1 Tax=Actinomadura viridis TaxID=58110 RepID=A0A931GMA3_9ACTN|nr:enoyl-CoA hydratase/isomerase family protein [Actinomadura viridis]MBG6092973.1 enoyl-CoA hydratase/carnithine racemase [Actinomadura viridis]